MLVFDHNFTNDEVDALLPYLRTVRASVAKEMHSDHIIVRDKSATAHAALSRIIKPMEQHALALTRGKPMRYNPLVKGRRYRR